MGTGDRQMKVSPRIEPGDPLTLRDRREKPAKKAENRDLKGRLVESVIPKASSGEFSGALGYQC